MLTRLRSERGLALPLALAIMLVLSIAVFAMLEFSSANTRNSSVDSRRQSAKALAEAGVARAASFLAQQGQTYTAATADFAVIDGVRVDWSATWAAPHWTVSATAAPRNPTGPGTSGVSRTVQAKFEWVPITPPALWNGLYIGKPGNRPLMSHVTASISTPVYARSDVTITQGKYLGHSFQVRGKFTLQGGATDSSIGASSRVSGTDGAGLCTDDSGSFKKEFPGECNRVEHRVADFRVRDGCASSTSGPWTAAACNTTSRTGQNSSGTTPFPEKLWLKCPTTPCSTTNVTSSGLIWPPTPIDEIFLTAPDVPPAQYDLGPLKPCATQTGSPPNFNGSDVELMTSATYTCTNGAGELSWNFGTKTLTAKGNIYFANSVMLRSGYHGLVGDGKGFIYVGTYLRLNPGTGLCGVRDTPAPRCKNGVDGSGIPFWNPSTANNLVSFVVGQNHESAILQDNFHLQGGLYASADPSPTSTSPPGGGYLVQGQSTFKGPLIIEGPVEIKDAGTIDAYAPLNSSGGGGGSAELKLVRGSWRG